jgi:N-terminal domain of reverse transcriptase
MTATTAAPAAKVAGAASHDVLDWHAIDWRRVHQTVRRLQVRIVKAIQASRWGKVHALQHLLTHSFSAKALAVRRVTENQGKRTAGVDRVTWRTPAQKTTAIGTLRQRGYRPQPLRRVYVAKSNGKLRGLGMPMSLAYCLSSPSGLGIVIAEALRLGQIEPVQTVATDRTAHTLPH